MKVLKFHQFVRIDKGPVNSAIINLLNGDIFQVSNDYIEKFEKGQYENIPEFINTLEEEHLIINVEEARWIPKIKIDVDKKKNEELTIINTLELEDGVDLEFVINRFNSIPINIKRIFFYGKENTTKYFQGIPIVRKKKDFSACETLSSVNEDFLDINENDYRLNMSYNSCWCGRLAVTAGGNFRPCIFSSLILGNIKEDANNIPKIIEELRNYWKITKDKVATCKDCELRYVCFDCREISLRNTNDLYGCNPFCNYDPYKGEWKN
jgi:radical SAM protein with 4Fe4S-binding SPASM domain